MGIYGIREGDTFLNIREKNLISKCSVADPDTVGFSLLYAIGSGSLLKKIMRKDYAHLKKCIALGTWSWIRIRILHIGWLDPGLHFLMRTDPDFSPMSVSDPVFILKSVTDPQHYYKGHMCKGTWERNS